LFVIREVIPDGCWYKLGRLGGDPRQLLDVLSAQVLADLPLEKEYEVSAKRLKGLRPVVIAVPRVASAFGGPIRNFHETSYLQAQAERIGFDPQNDNLHVTLSFFGDALQKPTTSPDTIMQLHKMIKDQVARFESEVLEEKKSIPLCITAFEQFPPGKHNLIVARLEFRDIHHGLFVRRLWLRVHYLLIAAGVNVREAPRLPSSISNRSDCPRNPQDVGSKTGSSSTALSDANAILDIVDNLSVQEVEDLTSDWQPHFTLGKIAATKAQLGQRVVTDLVRRLNERYAGMLVDSGTGDAATYKFLLSAIGIGMGGQTPVKAKCLNWNDLIIGGAASGDSTE